MAVDVVKLDEELDNVLSFYEVITHHGSRDRLKGSIRDLVLKWARAEEMKAGQ